MSKLLGISFLTVLGVMVPAVHAGSISYSAGVGCGNTCVTAYVEWYNFDPGVSFVIIEDNNGNFLFGLNTDPFPESTGQIDPNPQTVTGLSSDEINLINGGGSGVLDQSVSAEICCSPPPPANPTSAELVLEDVNHNVLGEVTFQSAPEPATWALTIFSLGLLGAWGIRRRRKLQTAPAAQ